MSGRWWRKRRRKARHSWFDVFHEIDRIEKITDEMMHQAFRTFSSPFEAPKTRGKSVGPHVYGFSISVDADGRPKIREFGDVHNGRYGPKIREQSEPLVDVLVENEAVVVVAELPGVEKEDIHLYASKDDVTIQVDTPQRKYQKELPLPEEVDPKPVQTSYNNGVLMVQFKKKGKRKKIRIL